MHKSMSTPLGRNIRCILFDLGNTLWQSTDSATQEAIEQTVNEQAVACLRSLLAPRQLPPIDTSSLGQRMRETVDQELRDAVRLRPEMEPDVAIITMQVLYSLGIPAVNRAVGQRIFEALNVPIPSVRCLYDDTISTLTTLKARGFKMGIVTNRRRGGTAFQHDLQAMGISSIINPEHMAISADVGWRKPHLELFLHSLRALGVSPEETVMVGDSIRADVGGAKRLGMLAVWKPKARLWAKARAATRAAHAFGERPVDYGKADAETVLLAYVSRRATKLGMAPEDAQPDLIIERLNDLLTAFPVGTVS